MRHEGPQINNSSLGISISSHVPKLELFDFKHFETRNVPPLNTSRFELRRRGSIAPREGRLRQTRSSRPQTCHFRSRKTLGLPVPTSRRSTPLVAFFTSIRAARGGNASNCLSLLRRLKSHLMACDRQSTTLKETERWSPAAFIRSFAVTPLAKGYLRGRSRSRHDILRPLIGPEPEIDGLAQFRPCWSTPRTSPRQPARA